MGAAAAAGPPDGAGHDAGCTLTKEDIYSLKPGCCVSTALIEEFFRSQFEACLRQEGVRGKLKSCLVFGPDTFADLRRLLLRDSEPGAGQQGYPALERFCREHDIASKQYLLLPLLTPSHGSLLVVCQPVEQQGTGKGKDRLELPWRGREQRPLILHLDSGRIAAVQHQPDFDSLVAFLQLYARKDEQASVDWSKAPRLTASVPQQRSAGLGSTFMCTSALYFVANLPPYIRAVDVDRMKNYNRKNYKLHPNDNFDDTKFGYPGFLSTEWYPRNVPDAFRKVLLSGVINRLQALMQDKGQAKGSVAHNSTLLVAAREVKSMLSSNPSRQFEMPEQRRARQEIKKEELEKRAQERIWALERERERDYWKILGGWEFSELAGDVSCRPGVWEIRLTGDLRESGGLPFRDIEYGKPQQFDFCFNVPLKAGQQPPSFILHIPHKLLSAKAASDAAAAGQEEWQLKMCFTAMPPNRSRKLPDWVLEKGCMDSLLDLLISQPQPNQTLCLKLRPDSPTQDGEIHLDFDMDPVLSVPPTDQPPASGDGAQSATSAGLAAAGLVQDTAGAVGAARATDAAGAAGATGAAGAAGAAVVAEAAGAAVATASKAGSEGAAAVLVDLQALPAAAPAGAAVPPDLSALLAAIAQPPKPTAKGAKRLATGRDGKGDRRARLTFKKKSYYAGSYADGRTAAQAEDLMAIWVLATEHGWQEGWMQECAAQLQPRNLNFPLEFYTATYGHVIAGLQDCADKTAMHNWLQLQLGGTSGAQSAHPAGSVGVAPLRSLPSASLGGTSPVKFAEELMSLVQRQHGVASAGDKRPAESAATGSSLSGKRQRGAAAGEQAATDVKEVDAAEQEAQQQALGAEEQQHVGQSPAQPAAGVAAAGRRHSQPEAAAAAGTALASASISGRDASAAAGGGAAGRCGSAADGGSWPEDARAQVLIAFDAAEAASSDEARIVAQIRAISAALQLAGSGVPEQLACTRQFRRINNGVLRSGLLAELRLIVEVGSASDVSAWIQDVSRSS